MDRHSNKEIKSMAAVLGCVMAGILLLSSVYLVYRYEERNRQAAQLALRYPWSEGVWIEIREAKNTADTQQADREKQKELQEKYGYYFFSAKESKEIFAFVCFGDTDNCRDFCRCGVFYQKKSKNRRKSGTGADKSIGRQYGTLYGWKF